MTRRRPLRGVRARLAVAIATILTVTLTLAALAVWRGTGTQVRQEIDQDLRADAVALRDQGIPRRVRSPADVAAAARRYVSAQPSFARSPRLFIIRVADGSTVTNEPELLGLRGDQLFEGESEARQRREAVQAAGLRRAPLGLSTTSLEDAGAVRLLIVPVLRGGVRVASVGVGEPLEAVRVAQHGVARTFLLAGLLALALGAIASYLVAARIAGPLRRMARTAARVDAGDLDRRIGARAPPEEIKVLGDALDHMLDRLADAFARQRAFVADASHELRTPLTVIRGQLEVLALQPEVSSDDVARVERQAGVEIARMERLIDDLLLLARVDEGELVRPGPIELAPFVDELIDGLTLTAPRGFELGSVPQGTLHGDGDRVAQALRNLVRNAVEHTDASGRVHVEVSADGAEVEFAVEDDGPGIAPDQRRAVFDRFHRTDSARARDDGGTGLGLAIVRAIVEAHGGSVGVGDSAFGGARVWFRLPGFEPAGARRSGSAPTADRVGMAPSDPANSATSRAPRA